MLFFVLLRPKPNVHFLRCDLWWMTTIMVKIREGRICQSLVYKSGRKTSGALICGGQRTEEDLDLTIKQLRSMLGLQQVSEGMFSPVCVCWLVCQQDHTEPLNFVISVNPEYFLGGWSKNPDLVDSNTVFIWYWLNSRDQLRSTEGHSGWWLICWSQSIRYQRMDERTWNSTVTGSWGTGSHPEILCLVHAKI